jgi:glucokinase
LGLDIGGTKTAVVLGRSPVEVLGREEFPTAGPQATLERALTAARRLAARVPGEALAAAGVACGGPLDAAAGAILSPPNLPAWRDVPVVELVARELGVPARLENDANAGALAEHRYGAGRGTRDFVFVTFGTGLGAGLIIGGRLHRGASGLAGELGHVRLAPDGPLAYGKRGSAEAFASGAGLTQAARRAADEALRCGSLLAGVEPEELTARSVGRAAAEGDELACELVEECGRSLGRALAVLVDVLNPECIAVGGLALRLGDLILDPARRELAAEALPQAVAACRVVPAALGEAVGDAQALVVAELALEGE